MCRIKFGICKVLKCLGSSGLSKVQSEVHRNSSSLWIVMKMYLVQCGCNLCSVDCVLHVPALFGWNVFAAFYGVPC